MNRSLAEHERDKLAGEIAALGSLDVAQPRGTLANAFWDHAPLRFSRDLPIRAVTYRVQERALGGLKLTIRRVLQRVAADAHSGPLKLVPLRTLERRAVLIREWNGVKHEVVVVKGGFSFRGQHYLSMSAVARRIMGNRWSGPLFFVS